MPKNNRKAIHHRKEKETLNHDVSNDHEPTVYEENIVMPKHEPRTFWTRLSENLSYMKYVILFLFIPPILNFGALQREAVALHPKGQKVDMGWGQKMYIHCEGSGLPTVILDAPTGSNSDIWLFIQEELAQITKVCVYDRSGIGSSDAIFNDVSFDKDFALNRRFVAQPFTLSQMTGDLHHLIKEAQRLPYPFVLVGAEMGSLIARMYAILHAEDVSGIVLIDPLVENLFSESNEWKEYWYSRVLPSYESLHLSAAVGLSRIALLLGFLQPSFFKEQVPADVLHRQKSLLCNPWHINSAFNEYLFMNTSFSQMSDAWVMNDFPESISVSVIRREQPAELPPSLFEVWKKSQKHLVSNLHHGCHNVIVTENRFLELYSKSTPIIAEVEKVINQWRRKHGSFPSFAE